MILITGAAGKTGRAIIQALRRRGVAIRALVHQNTRRTTEHSLGANEVVHGEMLDMDSFMRAAQGVRAIYHIAPNMHPAEITMGKNVIDIAQAADVERLVYHSVLHPQIKAMPHHWDKLRVEEMLFESHLPITILQPAAYMQNILSQRNRIVNQGLLQIPYPSSTRINIVDLHDIAEVAAITLTEPGHIGATYELAGPSALSQDELATQLGSQLGRNVQAVSISHKEWRNTARQNGLGDDVIEKLIAMFNHYARFDFTGNPNVLRWLLGKSPTSFADFVKREFNLA